MVTVHQQQMLLKRGFLNEREGSITEQFTGQGPRFFSLAYFSWLGFWLLSASFLNQRPETHKKVQTNKDSLEWTVFFTLPSCRVRAQNPSGRNDTQGFIMLIHVVLFFAAWAFWPPISIQCSFIQLHTVVFWLLNVNNCSLPNWKLFQRELQNSIFNHLFT